MKWNKESAKLDALKYNSRKDWKLGKGSSYGWSMKNCKDFIDEFTSHMRPAINLCGEVYLVYAYEFPDNSVYVGLTSDEEKRKYKHNRIGPVFDNIQKGLAPVYTVISRNLGVRSAAELETETIKDYKSRGFIVLNSRPGGELEAIRRLTFEQALENAKSFRSRTEWSNGSSAYQTALTRGWLDDIAEKLGWPAHKGHKWTPETLELEASKYSSRGEWSKAPGGSYLSARRLGILDSIADKLGWPNYKTAQSKWNYESCLNEARKFSRSSDWQYRCKNGSYISARRKGWLKRIYNDLGWKARVEQRTKIEDQKPKSSCYLSSDRIVTHFGFENAKLIHLIVGPPASGKSWVCRRAAQAGFDYVDHDKLSRQDRLSKLEDSGDKVIFDPFTASTFVRRNPFRYKVFVIVEDERTIYQRRMERSGKADIKKIRQDLRTAELAYRKFGYFKGTSEQVLQALLCI